MPDLLTIAQIGSIATAALGLTTTLVTRTAPWIRTKLTSRAVTRRLGTILTEGQVERAVRYYVEPMCQDVDPAEAEEPRPVINVRQRLFKALDKALTHPTEFRYIFLLADSGTGKSSALINYYARHLRRLRSNFEIELIPLGIPNADERIANLTDKASKVLFLDAFDEDTLAVVDHLERLRNLLSATKEFRRVVITCRTQFFGKDDEIPVRTGLFKVGARGPGEPAEYLFHKIYLSPFGDKEIRRYINKRYPAWRLRLRRQAIRTVSRIPNLSVRPMLLAHIDDLVKEHQEAQSSLDLYERMIEAWIRREEGFIRNHADLRRFSDLLAVDIYLNREQRGAERITSSEIRMLAENWKIPIESWALTGRSLLNRDAEGNFKFSHRSIMEFLFLRGLSRGETRCAQISWTGRMRDFFWEGIQLQTPWVIESLRIARDNHDTKSGIINNLFLDENVLFEFFGNSFCDSAESLFFLFRDEPFDLLRSSLRAWTRPEGTHVSKLLEQSRARILASIRTSCGVDNAIVRIAYIFSILGHVRVYWRVYSLLLSGVKFHVLGAFLKPPSTSTPILDYLFKYKDIETRFGAP